MVHRSSFFLSAVGAAVLASGACHNDRLTSLASSDLSGEWDFAAAIPGDEAGTCTIAGALLLTRSGETLTGTAATYASYCGSLVSGEIVGGTISGTSIQLSSGVCSLNGTQVTADSIAGAATCRGAAGTWTAARVGPASKLVIVPGDRSLVVGGAQGYAPSLYDAAGHVLYGRSVEWSSSDPNVASVTLLGGATSVLVLGVGPGTASVTATSEVEQAV